MRYTWALGALAQMKVDTLGKGFAFCNDRSATNRQIPKLPSTKRNWEVKKWKNIRKTYKSTSPARHPLDPNFSHTISSAQLIHITNSALQTFEAFSKPLSFSRSFASTQSLTTSSWPSGTLTETRAVPLENVTTSGETQSPLGTSRFLELPVSHQAELTMYELPTALICQSPHYDWRDGLTYCWG